MPIPRPGFNPTRVRLKPLRAFNSLPAPIRLQPHKGSSETRLIRSASVVRDSLQPHKGSSETVVTAGGLTSGSLQPHKGSSETAVRCPFRATSRSFNPTRVRLKLGDYRIIADYETLQPHKGSSETVSTRTSRRTPTTGFNPTRVRLKLWHYCKRADKLAGFNPTRVRLKRRSSSP